MRIGYACLTVGVRDTNFRTCILKNASDENLRSIIQHNLTSLDHITDYNIKNNIKLFRLSSGIIPFGSSPVNKLKWWDLFEQELAAIGEKIKEAGMRVSMHPGQYTVLNSPREEVVERAVKDLEYHTRFLDSLGVNSEHKIILHVGGVYGDKESALTRFIENYKLLDLPIKKRLVIENDDKCFRIEDVLYLSKHLHIPVIYDNLHNQVFPSDDSKEDRYWIERANKTWTKKDGLQKIHYSQQDEAKRLGAHSTTIQLSKFMEFIEGLENRLDIMLEVKDKNLSAVKCINAIQRQAIKNLELEWSKYKYTVLEYSPKNYEKIRNLLKDKTQYPVLEFYGLIENALEMDESIGNSVNAAQHVWGYFKDIASADEKKKFDTTMKDYQDGKIKKNRVKNVLDKLSIKYQMEYLLDSYYFSIW